MKQVPLTAAARALRDEILAIPITDEPMMDDVPEGFDLDTLDGLHRLALSGSQKAAPELRKLSARYPEFPKLLNYLHVAHTLRGEHRQAEAAMKQLAKEHPDYLFTRIALANKALGKERPEQAAAALNPSLSLRDLYPDRDLFHLSEIKNYYFCVARILAQRGDPELARGVKAALWEIQPDENEDYAVIHALHFLGEIGGHEACPVLLRLLAMHPEAVDFWIGPVEIYSPQIVRIIAGALPDCFAWLKLPGIGSYSKGIVTEAMEQLAKSDSSRLPEISAGLGDVLAFVIDSPPQDNILDTGYLFILIGTLAELRTAEHLPLIRKAYEKDLIELCKVGPFDEVEEDMSKPINRPHKLLSMVEQYESYLDGGDEDEDDFEDEEEDTIPFLPPARFSPPPARYPAAIAPSPAKYTAPASSPLAGRNDPCPCGSGRKFKKCCLR